MRTIIGIIIVVVSSITFYYFDGYNGELIPYPWLWMIVSVLVFIIGGWLIKSGLTRPLIKAVKQELDQIAKFKTDAEKIPVDFDSCTFGDRSYLSAVVNTEGETERHEHVGQSYLSFRTGGETFTGSFAVSSVALKAFILSNKVYLYVDRRNSKDYVFDIEDK